MKAFKSKGFLCGAAFVVVWLILWGSLEVIRGHASGVEVTAGTLGILVGGLVMLRIGMGARRPK